MGTGNKVQDKLDACLDRVLSLTKGQAADPGQVRPRLGLVLGSGLGALADAVEDPLIVDYKDIEGFPVSTAPGHVGRFIFGRLEGVPLVLMQGRVHLYEGYDVTDCVLPIRLMGLLGIETLVLTNAAGACNPDYRVGDFCILRDHISSFVPSPLLGPNLEGLGRRFPDMTRVYDEGLQDLMEEAGKEAGCRVHRGVYIQFTGPAYETPAEIRMARTLGADMVGMSTVIEATAANHMGLKTCGVSFASNMAAGLSGSPLTEEEVIEEGKRQALAFQAMIRSFLRKLPSQK